MMTQLLPIAYVTIILHNDDLHYHCKSMILILVHSFWCRADYETKLKLEKIQETKRLSQLVAASKSEIMKNQDHLADLYVNEP
jgi:hypothetical protein